MLTKIRLIAKDLDKAIKIADDLISTLELAENSNSSDAEVHRELRFIQTHLPNLSVMKNEKDMAYYFINSIINFKISIPEALETVKQVRDDFVESRKLINL